MASEYKVIADSFCITPGHKARKIERHLNEHAKDGWRLDTLNGVFFVGIDVGFYIVLRRERD